MKWIYIIISILVSLTAIGQSTFSKIYDLDTSTLRNYIKDFEIIDNYIFTYSAPFCPIEDSLYWSCIALAKYNMQGDIIRTINIDSLNATDCCIEGLTTDGDKIIASTYVWGEFGIQGEYDNITIMDFDSNLDQLKVQKYNEESLTHSTLINSGIEIINGYRYVYGSIANHEYIPDSVHIIKTDLEGNELDRFYYSYGNSSLEINNFQATPDGNFAFILKIKSPNGANTGFNGYQLMKIDTSGDVLDTFVFKDKNSQPNRLLVTFDGGYVFSSIDHPITGGDIFTTGYGLINKMDANMDTLEWSLILPNDQLLDGRKYRIYDYIESSNGDIVACGTAFDNTDTELSTGVPDKNSTWNGFIVRLTPDGEIKWLRLYKNNNDLLPQDEYGRFRPSLLKDIKELSDGRFVAAGNVFVNTPQFYAINEFETEAFHLWLLMVDENGCLEGQECQEIIRLDSVVSYDPAIFSLGTRWTYDYFPESNNPNEIIHSFVDYTLTDTLRIENELIYRISNNRNLPEILMKQYENEISFWNEEKQLWQMTYDYDAFRSYVTDWDSNNSLKVNIDSVAYPTLWFGDRGFQPIQFVSIINNGDTLASKEILKTCGSLYGGLTFENYPLVGHIRCFEQDSFAHNFGPFFMPPPCDTVWTEIINSTENIEIGQSIIVYPNPVTNILKLSNYDSTIKNYKIFNLLGQIIKQGEFNREIDMSYLPSSTYLIRIFDDSSNFKTLKFIKL